MQSQTEVIPSDKALVPTRRGRPSGFDWQIAEEICEWIAEGGSLLTYCERAGKPSQSMVYRWLRQNDKFRESYARAREDQADKIFDEMLEIADDGRNDWMDRETRGGTIRVADPEAVARSKLRIEARKWMAGKLRPKVYGEKGEITHKLDASDAFVEMLRMVSAGDGGKLVEAK